MKNAENLKFFIVDDDPFCRMMYEQHLINLGYVNNRLFENGLDCIENLEGRPDVIFIDYDMLPINGIETLKRIKQQKPHIHLLIISAQKDVQVAVNALKHGAFDYIVKGDNDLDMISQVINNIVSLRAAA